MRREITEELERSVEVRGYPTTTEYEYSFGIVSPAVYYAGLKGDDPQLTEHAEIRWLAVHELFGVEWVPGDITAVELVAKQFTVPRGTSCRPGAAQLWRPMRAVLGHA